MKRINKYAQSFPVWKTIGISTNLNTAVDFQEAIEAEGMKIGYWAKSMLSESILAAPTEKVEIELVKIAVVELFENGATRKDLYAHAINLGLALCPSRIGPELRLQYKDQPKGEWFFIAMEPVVYEASAPEGLPRRERLLSIEHNVNINSQNDGLWLNTHWLTLDLMLKPNFFFVFIRGKK